MARIAPLLLLSFLLLGCKDACERALEVVRLADAVADAVCGPGLMDTEDCQEARSYLTIALAAHCSLCPDECIGDPPKSLVEEEWTKARLKKLENSIRKLEENAK